MGMRTWTVVDSNGWYQDVTADSLISEEGKDRENVAYFYHPAYVKEEQ